VKDAYERYEYHVVYHSIYRFCVVEMSAFYLDIIKDRLYCSHPKSRERRSAQTVLFAILDQLVRISSPVFAFTAEEVWREIPAFHGKEESVHLAEINSVRDGWLSEEDRGHWEKVAQYRETVLKLMEEARQRKEIGSSLEAKVLFEYAPAEEATVRRFENLLPDLFIASQVQLKPGPETRFSVVPAGGRKCQRCWQIREDVGSRAGSENVCARCAGVLDRLTVDQA
ncbi:MAG TPA: class I tRNA ligase family protein, partial [Acidobacteriota bacterium]|nr:class I tRNA ligase family protein [Acidobacteriota bacterium]